MAAEKSNHKIQQLIEQQINLPSPPTIAVQILNTVQDKDSSLNDLEKIISADPALTGKMLQIANSAFYSLPNKVSNITRAMSLLGTNVIKNIALSFVIARELRQDATSFFDFDYFWKRSVTTAVAAELLKNFLQNKNDDIFVTALLQDLGVLIFYLGKGEEYTKLLADNKANSTSSLIEKEEKEFQFNHQQLSHILISNWGLPKSISTPIRYHHEPENAPDEYCQTAGILSIANLLSAIYNKPETAADVLLLQSRTAEMFDMDTPQTNKLLDEVASKSVAVLEIFELDPSDMKPYSQMLQEANDELGRLNFSYEQLVMALKESKNQAEQFANDLKLANEKLEDLAFRDGLTNLYNHRYFQEILNKEIARAQRYKVDLSLIIFDIDSFKAVNDTHGHPAGDQVLINLSEQIENVIRPSDIIARYGGEEFAVILPDTKESGMKVFAERLRRCVMGIKTKTNNAEIKVTISSGGVHFKPDSDSTAVTKQNLIDTADRALYKSKEKGKNCVTVLPLNQ